MNELQNYLETLSADRKKIISHIYDVAKATVPEATEGKSYGMPALLYKGKGLISCVSAKNHLSIVPFSPPAIEAIKDRLEEYEPTKGVIRFSEDNPIDDNIIKELLKIRKAEIENK